MPIELPVPWLITVDILAWLVIHLGVAWLGTQLPVTLFNPNATPYRQRGWERRGRLYERLFRIKVWKDMLPDGAALFARGFPKARLNNGDPAYVERFIRETCRGEAVHWGVMMTAPLFFLWNPPYVGIIMIVYAAIANLPCILAQRYNRIRLNRLLSRMCRPRAVRS
ncbi:MAG: glycosyl-4,4'-diaponeurosporenoate acyltransferase [Candidatus Pacebacteria bacterium]|nr:glycosyl-4,4'-diaponeurosporenoate acyltransferase [Candidatus Paceibacterota bacterium]